MLKIAFIGAGSVVFTRNLLADLLSFPELEGCSLSLHDIDPLRLETAEAIARSTARQLGAAATIEAHLERSRALEGARYVINMIQVGGHAATLVDFEIPRQYGLQQTIGDSHGIGGIFRGLRTMPVLLDLARDMQILCPDALLLNYTNPMAMLCWAIFKATSISVVGLCHSVQGTIRQMSQYAGLPQEEVVFLAGGINHMSWILRFRHRGQDAYPLLWQALAEGRIPENDAIRAEIFRRLGYYVTESSEHMAEYSAYFLAHPQLIERYHLPIGEYLRRSEKNLIEFEQVRAQVLHGEPLEIKRSAEYAARIVHSIETGQPAVIYGNVRNDHLIENLPVGCCVEAPCLVDGNGIQPTHLGLLPPQLAGMNLPHVAVQELAVRAVLEGRRDYVFQAAMLDPLASATLTLEDMREMIEKLLEEHGPLLPPSLRQSAVDEP